MADDLAMRDGTWMHKYLSHGGRVDLVLAECLRAVPPQETTRAWRGVDCPECLKRMPKSVPIKRDER